MAYKVVVTSDAEADLDMFLSYLIFEKESIDSARNILNDFEITKKRLEDVAASLKLCDNQRLHDLGYRRINFQTHRYFMLYRIVNEKVIVDNIFHSLQDYENKMD